MMYRQYSLETHRDVAKFLYDEMFKLMMKPFLKLHEEPNKEYIYKPLKERMHCLEKNRAEETFCFEDNLLFKAENPYSHMGDIFEAPLCARAGRYHSTPKCLWGNNEPYVGNTLYTKIVLKTSQLQDKSSGCNLNKNSELFSPEKRKKTVHRVSSFVIASTVFLWVVMDIHSKLSTIQLQPKFGPIFILSSFLKLFGFMAFVSATGAMIVVGAPFSGMQSFMLMIWAILMLVNSAKSITEVYLPLLGIIFSGCYVLVLK